MRIRYPLGKSEKRKEKKRKEKEKKKRAKERQGDKKDRKQQKEKGGKSMSFLSSSCEIQINILYSYVNMKSNWFYMFCTERREGERERGRERERDL